MQVTHDISALTAADFLRAPGVQVRGPGVGTSYPSMLTLFAAYGPLPICS